MITLYQPIGITSYQLYIVSVVPVVVSCSYNKIVLVTVSKISFHPYKPRLALLACIRQRDLGRTSRVALVAAYVNLTLKLLLTVEDPDRALFKPPHCTCTRLPMRCPSSQIGLQKKKKKKKKKKNYFFFSFFFYPYRPPLFPCPTRLRRISKLLDHGTGPVFFFFFIERLLQSHN